VADFEETLNAILSDQAAMGQIMALAQSLSGNEDHPGQESATDGSLSRQPEPPFGPDLSALLGDIDPTILQMGMQVMKEFRQTDDRNAALLQALRPFLREERRSRLDRALQIARMTRLIRTALGAMGGKGEAEGV